MPVNFDREIKHLSLALILVAAFASACSEARLSSDTIKTRTLADGSIVPESGPEESLNENTDEGNSSEISQALTPLSTVEVQAAATEPEVSEINSNENISVVDAAMPVPIAGAYLVCSHSPSAPLEARCNSFTRDGALVDFPYTAVRLVTKAGLEKIATTAIRLNVGSYSVALPATLSGSFAIAFSSDALQTIADWVRQPNDPLVNKVVDGSFESFVFPDGQTLTSQPTDASTAWALKNAPGSFCSEPLWEIHRIPYDLNGPSDGTKWVELNTMCNAEVRDVANVEISQIIQGTAGNLYEILFDYRRRGAGLFNSLFAEFDGEALGSIHSANPEWATYRIVVQAKSNAIPLKIYAGGTGNDTMGPQLDNVRVIDLGKASDFSN